MNRTIFVFQHLISKFVSTVIGSRRNPTGVLLKSHQSVTQSTTMASKNEIDTATFILLTSLPKEFHGLWFTSEALAKHLHDGGIRGIDKKTVTYALRSDKVIFKRNKYKNKVHFMFGAPIRTDWTPQMQKSRDSKEISFLPHMPVDFFKKQDDLKDAVSVLLKHFCPPPGPNVTTRAAAAAAANATPIFCQPLNCNDPKGLTIPEPELSSGFVLQDIGLDHEWTKTVLEHGKLCKSAKLIVVRDEKRGFELVTTYQCTFCQRTLLKCRSYDSRAPTHCGPKGSAVNLNMAHGLFSSGTNVQKGLEMFAEAGIMSPSPRNLQLLIEKEKQSIMNLSEGQLRMNQKEHVAACRLVDKYPGDIVWTKDGKEYCVARGAIASDGAGETRAYNHHITGSQHCLVIFSLVTNKPIYLHNDQISCKRCSLALVRRNMGHMIKLLQMEKEDDKKSFHRSDKLPPTDDCKSSSKPKAKRKSRCSNCRDPNHQANDCEEPLYNKRRKRQKTVVAKDKIFEMLNIKN